MAADPIICEERPDGTLIEIKSIPVHAIPVEERIERKAETLAEKILNDAEELLEEANNKTYIDANGEVQKADTIKTKKYVASVVGIVSKMVQGKQSLRLKKNEDTRNNASFLMDLLKKAQSGEMNLTQIDSLKQKNINEQTA